MSCIPVAYLSQKLCVSGCVGAETSRVDGSGDHRAEHREGQAVSPEVGEGGEEKGLGCEDSQAQAVRFVGVPRVQATVEAAASRARYRRRRRRRHSRRLRRESTLTLILPGRRRIKSHTRTDTQTHAHTHIIPNSASSEFISCTSIVAVFFTSSKLSVCPARILSVFSGGFSPKARIHSQGSLHSRAKNTYSGMQGGDIDQPSLSLRFCVDAFRMYDTHRS